MFPDTVGGQRARQGEGGGALRGSSRPARYAPPHPAGPGAQVGAAATLPGRVTQQPPRHAGREAHSFPTRGGGIGGGRPAAPGSAEGRVSRDVPQRPLARPPTQPRAGPGTPAPAEPRDAPPAEGLPQAPSAPLRLLRGLRSGGREPANTENLEREDPAECTPPSPTCGPWPPCTGPQGLSPWFLAKKNKKQNTKNPADSELPSGGS